MSVLGREQRSWEDFKKEYLATESIIQSLDIKPIRVYGKKGSWRGKVESVMSPETGSLGHRALWPKAASTDQKGKKGGIPQQQSRF